MKEAEINGQKLIVTSSVDAVGLFCPMPIVHLKLELENSEPDQVVEVLADDAGFGEDVAHWCKETENSLLSLSKNEEGVFVAYVKKA